MSLPSIFYTRDPFTSQHADMLDRMFDLSFPWKLMKAFGDGSTQAPDAYLKPALDVTSDDKAYTVTVEIPGISADDVKLEIKDHALVLSGEKKEEKVEGTNQHITFFEQLFLRNSFSIYINNIFKIDSTIIDIISSKQHNR